MRQKKRNLLIRLHNYCRNLRSQKQAQIFFKVKLRCKKPLTLPSIRKQQNHNGLERKLPGKQRKVQQPKKLSVDCDIYRRRYANFHAKTTLPHQAQRKAQLQCTIHFEYIGHVSHKGHHVPVKKPTSNVLKNLRWFHSAEITLQSSLNRVLEWQFQNPKRP